MNKLIEIFKDNANWIDALILVITAGFTTIKFLRKQLNKLGIGTCISLIRDVPSSIKKIESSQTQLCSELQIQNKIITAILDTLDLAHFLCDAEGKCIKVNNSWVTLTGLQEKDALGHNWQLSVHPDDREHIQEKWKQMIEDHSPFEEVFRYLHRETNAITTVQCHATDVTDKDGRRIFVLGFSKVLAV